MTEELIHVRCISCGKVLANKWNAYKNMIGQGLTPEVAMTRLGLTRYCCRMWMTNPFKIPMRQNQAGDAQNQLVDLTVNTPTTVTTPVAGALDAMQEQDPMQLQLPTTPQLPATPGTPATPGGITLDPIIDVNLPAVPVIGAPVKTMGTKYMAW